MIVVGSEALAHFGLSRRVPKDHDVWMPNDLEITSMDIDGKDAMFYPRELLNLVPTEGVYATPDAVYTMKCSHLGWDVHWQKTKLDIIWLESKGCKIVPELYDRLVLEWQKEYGDKSFLSLKQDKTSFFTDNVKYVYDHDYLHELVAFPNKPMYSVCLKDGEDVLIDKDKFDAMEFNDKVQMFREEITVIACERWLLNPHWKGKVSWTQAYSMSLKKTITSLTKGWATTFITVNLKEFIKPNYKCFEHLLKTLGEEEMSVLDIFREINESYPDGEDGTIEGLIYAMASNEYRPEVEIENQSQWPNCSLKKTDKAEYDRLYMLYRLDVRKEQEMRQTLLSELGYEHIVQDGGGEGGAEDCHGVFKLKGKIYMAEYRYYSHEGHEYESITDTVREVKPVTKTVTVYE
jgi:hypothetical protein